jgi:hypothetical protein
LSRASRRHLSPACPCFLFGKIWANRGSCGRAEHATSCTPGLPWLLPIQPGLRSWYRPWPGLAGWGHETWRFDDHGSRLGACPCQAAIGLAPAPGLGALQADHRHTHGMCRQERPGDQALGPFDPASTGARGPHLAAGAGLGAVSSTRAPDLRPTWFYPCRHGERATGRRRTACPAIEGLVPYSIPRTRDTWQSPRSVILHKAPSQASCWSTMAKHGGPAGVRPRSIPWASFAGQDLVLPELGLPELAKPWQRCEERPARRANTPLGKVRVDGSGLATGGLPELRRRPLLT